MAKFGGPVHADEVVFGEDDDGRDVKIGELGAQVIVENKKISGAMEIARAIVEHAVCVEKFGDGAAIAAIPDFFEPMDDELFIALEKRKRLAGGGHGMPPGKSIAGVYRKGRGVASGEAGPNSPDAGVEFLRRKRRSCRMALSFNLRQAYIWRETVNQFFKTNTRKWINWWPPLLGAGIRVTRCDENWRAVDVELPLRWWNRNYVGTQYGGSLYSMADPFYMVMLIENLGSGYVVWDKSATIRFRRPGRGKVRAEFRLSEELVGEIRAAVEREGKIEREFAVNVTDESGEVVAEVTKLLHVRKRKEGGEKGSRG